MLPYKQFGAYIRDISLLFLPALTHTLAKNKNILSSFEAKWRSFIECGPEIFLR
jgi:hypothetical protein